MRKRDIDVEEYYQAMKMLKTSGLDITVLILSHLLKVKTLILIRDFLWKSVEADVNEFDVFLMLFTSGRFVSASPRNKSKLELEVPVFARTLIQPSPINVVIGSVPNLPVDTVGEVHQGKHSERREHGIDNRPFWRYFIIDLI